MALPDVIDPGQWPVPIGHERAHRNVLPEDFKGFAATDIGIVQDFEAITAPEYGAAQGVYFHVLPDRLRKWNGSGLVALGQRATLICQFGIEIAIGFVLAVDVFLHGLVSSGVPVETRLILVQNVPAHRRRRRSRNLR